jgi:dTDP-4-amino-4,6-dideoxygalactose transaminase
VQGKWPTHSAEEIAAAVKILESGNTNYWTGTECRDFETEFAAYHGTNYAIALANGTLALELALRVLGIGAGDEVVVTPRSYFASASCVALSGAQPVFADVDRDSQNVTAATLESRITEKTRAFLIVHLAGWPCDMPAIIELAQRHSIKVIEDCAQAHGARIDGKFVGSFGDAAAFSFCQDKIMSTAGEGGMFLTNDQVLWRKAWEFKDHGKSWDRVYAEDHRLGFRWLHESFGSNWRMTEIQGAIGRIQLAKLDGWVKTRRANAERLRDGLQGLALLRIPWPDAREYHAFYKFYVFVRPERLKSGWSRDRILSAMQAEGVPGLSGSCPEIYREKAFEGQNPVVRPVAQELGETSLMLMVHPTLQPGDIDDMIGVIRKVCEAATK